MNHRNFANRKDIPDLFAPTTGNGALRSISTMTSKIGHAIRRVINAAAYNPRDVREFMDSFDAHHDTRGLPDFPL